jgi:hypothetical protein
MRKRHDSLSKFVETLDKKETRRIMISLASTHPAKSSGARSLGYDFALLGLQARESRVDVIRNAAEKTALKIQRDAEDDQRVEMLSELAMSTYRLLDPRRRRRTMERVQLSNIAECEPPLATVAKSPLLAPEISATFRQESLVVAELVEEAVIDSDSTLANLVSRTWLEKSLEKRAECRMGFMAMATLLSLLASIALIGWVVSS